MTEQQFITWAKEFAATYCSTLTTKQYNIFVISLAKVLRDAYLAGQKDTKRKEVA